MLIGYIYNSYFGASECTNNVPMLSEGNKRFFPSQKLRSDLDCEIRQSRIPWWFSEKSGDLPECQFYEIYESDIFYKLGQG